MGAFEWSMVGLIAVCVIAFAGSSRTWTLEIERPAKKPIDWEAVAAVEHALADEHPDEWGPETWVHDCSGDTGLHQACAARRAANQVAAARNQGGHVAAPGPFLEVRSALTVNEQREIERRFWRAEARPTVLVGDVQVQRLTCPQCDTFEVAVFGQEQPVATYKQLCEDCQSGESTAPGSSPAGGSGWGPVDPAQRPELFTRDNAASTVDLEVGVEPDEPGPE